MNRAGTYKKNLSGKMAFNSFVPAVLPPNPPIELNNEIVEILVKANRQITLLEGISSRIPNIDLFISMYVRKEALPFYLLPYKKIKNTVLKKEIYQLYENNYEHLNKLGILDK